MCVHIFVFHLQDFGTVTDYQDLCITQFEKEILSLLNNAKDKILRNLRQKYPFTPDRTESKTKYFWGSLYLL